MLTETRFLELKRELKPNVGDNNRETARDVAQFALDGGTVLFGMKERPGGAVDCAAGAARRG